MTLRQILSALSVVVGLTVSAQRVYSPDFCVGVKGGATISEMAWSPSVRQGFTPGVTFGLVARYTEEKYFGLIAELNITQRGWKEALPKETGLTYSRHFTYIQLPVMTHIYFGSRKFRGFVNLGPSVGYMLKEQISSNFDYVNVGSVPNYPQNFRTDQLNMPIARKFDYGIVGGVGAEARFARKHSVVIEGRFYYGLANVFPSKRGDVFGASRSMSIEVTAAYLFRLK